MKSDVFFDAQIHLDPMRLYNLALCHVIQANPHSRNLSLPEGSANWLIENRWVTVSEEGNWKMTPLGRREVEATQAFAERHAAAQASLEPGNPDGTEPV